MKNPPKTNPELMEEISLLRRRIRDLEQSESARKEAEEALRESERRERERAKELAIVLEAVPTPVVIVHDREGTHMTGNRASDELLRQEHGAEVSLSAPPAQKPRHFRAMKDGRELRLDELPAQRAASGEHVRDFEFSLVFDDDTTRHLLGYGTPLLDEKGDPRGAVHVLVDITDRKHGEEALARARAEAEQVAEELRTVLELAPVAIWIAHDPQCLKITGNRYADEIMKAPRGANISLTAAPGEGAVAYRMIKDGEEMTPHELPAQTAAAGRPVPPEMMELAFPDGRTVALVIGAVPLFSADGRVRGSLTAGSDITSLKKAEEALRASEEQLRSYFELGLVGMAIASPDKGLIDANEKVCEILGYGKEELLRMTWAEITHVDDLAADTACFNRVLAGEIDGYSMDKRFVRKDGEIIDTTISVKCVRNGHGFADHFVALIQDITERRRAENRLASNLNTLTLMHALSTTVLETGRLEPVLQEIMEAAVAIAGAEKGTLQLAREDALDIVAHHGHEGPFLDFFASAENVASVCGEATRRGRRVVVEDVEASPLFAGTQSLPILRNAGVRAVQSTPLMSRKGELLGILTTQWSSPHVPDEHDLWRLDLLARQAADIIEHTRDQVALQRAYDSLELRVRERTAELDQAYVALQCEMDERRRTEEQLRQSQKMEAIGTLAGGIAHDFNNILAAILGFTEMAIEDASDRPELGRSLQNVLKSAMRARDLVKQILAFSRKTSHERIHLSLTPLIEETVQLLRASIPATIEITLHVTAAADTVLASPVEVQQILMNLATNASHAMQDKGGTLEVSLTDVDFAPDSPVVGPDVLPGEYLQLAVKDTGTGMNSEVMKRVFEPFFTTREVGKGTGMGLAVVYGIVKDLQGAVIVESAPGMGSTFRVLLPKVETGLENEGAGTTQAPGGKEKILFVDDEAMLVEWSRAVLKRLGYDVTATTDGLEALRTFSSDPYGFDLVVTDQTMLSMTGIHLSRELLRIRPGMPIILCTGHSETVSSDMARKAGIRECLMKPLTKQELAAAIRRALDVEDKARNP